MKYAIIAIIALAIAGCSDDDDPPPPTYTVTVVRTSPVAEARQRYAVPVGQSLTILSEDPGERWSVLWYFQPGITVVSRTEYWATVRPAMDGLEVGILYSPLPDGAN